MEDLLLSLNPLCKDRQSIDKIVCLFPVQTAFQYQSEVLTPLLSFHADYVAVYAYPIAEFELPW